MKQSDRYRSSELVTAIQVPRNLLRWIWCAIAVATWPSPLHAADYQAGWTVAFLEDPFDGSTIAVAGTSEVGEDIGPDRLIVVCVASTPRAGYKPTFSLTNSPSSAAFSFSGQVLTINFNEKTDFGYLASAEDTHKLLDRFIHHGPEVPYRIETQSGTFNNRAAAVALTAFQEWCMAGPSQ